jgi:SagB-type dehydrogenase family enzyme
MGFCGLWNETTRLDHQKIRSRNVDRSNPPPSRKKYTDAHTLPLPSPGTLDTPPGDLWDVLHRRRSQRRYDADATLKLGELAVMLWACQGVTARQGPYLLRPAPSAGALYPFETYVIANRVEGVASGLLHLDVEGFGLDRVKEGELASGLVEAALGQRFLADAPAVVIWTAVTERCEWKYGDRASRYIPLDIGHACQNLCLAATALGLGSCAVGAFLDEPLNRLMGLDGEEEYAFYLASVGAAKR